MLFGPSKLYLTLTLPTLDMYKKHVMSLFIAHYPQPSVVTTDDDDDDYDER